ncbi:MAG TPA: phosphosulfolactate synthase [Chitinophagaceae bacterium]|nr:phosphosulfolactate synthase [Chitinophagaceae bacterium]
MVKNDLFGFLKTNPRGAKPRKEGITEIRGPYYTVMGRFYLKDVLETMGQYIDSLKFAGGSFTLLPKDVLHDIIETAHANNVLVSTGGFIEYVMTQGKEAVEKYIAACKQAGFDIIELSCGFITLTTNDWLHLIKMVQRAGLKAKPEIGIQFGAGGATPEKDLKAEGIRDMAQVVYQAKCFFKAGVDMIMIESEGITENTNPWRTDIIAQFMNELDPQKLMFEAADPPVFEWYIKNYGHNINLFVDHSQIVQLECLRSGIWGTKSTWGRIQGLK